MSINFSQHSGGVFVGTADKDHFLTAEGEVTTDESEAHQLLIRKGQEIPKEMADKYGIGKTEKAEKAAEPSAPKKGAKPAANKSAEPASNKESE